MNSLQAAKNRLDTFHEKKYMVKKDWLCMLVITVIYAVFAFTNLGVHEIPSTSTNVNETVTIQFDTPQSGTTLAYYADYGMADFKILYSADGENYYAYTYENDDEQIVDTVRHEKKNLYKWHVYDLSELPAYQYLKLEPVGEEGDLPILEVAVRDSEGNLVQGRALTQAGEQALWFDEQELVPEQRTYMTDFYFDELYHVRTAYENIHELQPYEITHPPLGKIILSVGIHMFGMNPFGWRFMGTLTGVIMLPVMYLLAKMLLKKTKYAVFATILFAVDFMHFAQTRIGTIDSYSILWIMLMYVFMFRYMQTNFNKQSLGKTFVPLFLCGLFFGIGAATKWLCIYAGAGLLALFLITMYKRYKEYRYAVESGDEVYASMIRAYRKNVVCTLLFCVLVFIVIPLVIYIASYAPYFMVTEGRAYTSLTDIWNNQKYMLDYHANLDPDHVHPFSSMWYTWIVDARPVLFFSHQFDGMIATLSTMGNPLIWWTGFIAAIWLIVWAIKGKHRSANLAFVAIAALSQLVPWVFVTREVFIYHYFATVPFLILLTVFWLKYLERDFKYGKRFGYIFIAACVVLFALFYPVITGVPANAEYINAIRWLPSWPFY